MLGYERQQDIDRLQTGQLSESELEYLRGLPLVHAENGVACVHGDFMNPRGFLYVQDAGDVLENRYMRDGRKCGSCWPKFKVRLLERGIRGPTDPCDTREMLFGSLRLREIDGIVSLGIGEQGKFSLPLTRTRPQPGINLFRR